MKSNCTEGKLANAHQGKVKDKEKDLKKAVKELEKAKTDKKSDKKIKAKQDKVDEKTKELESVKAPRSFEDIFGQKKASEG